MKRYLKIYTFLSAASLFLSCKEETNKEKAVETAPASDIVISEAEFKEKDLALVQMKEQNFPTIITTTGRIEVPPENQITISAFVGGYVNELSLLEGSEVQRGELLLTLENPEYVALQQEYLEVFEQLNFLKADFERQRTMLEENITSRKNFLKAESTYKTHLARANGLKQKLQMLNINPKDVEAGTITSKISIYSPLDGKVSQVNVTRGMYVPPTHNIMEILNTEHIHLELTLFERDIMRVEEGQTITFTTPEISSENFKAEVYLVGRSIDSENRTLPVHAHIPDSLGNRFAVGMFVDAKIAAEENLQPALPMTAVQESSIGTFAWVLKENSGGSFEFERQLIESGEIRNGFISIKNLQDFEGKQILSGFRKSQ